MSVSDAPSPAGRPSAVPARPGVGFKPEHFAAIQSDPGAARWFEVHAENYMGAGGPPHARLSALRERYAMSVHGVGLSIGSEGGLDAEHLGRLAEVVRRYEPGLVSEHLAWSTHDGAFLNDLLPAPYTPEIARRVAEHIDQVQEALGRTILLENPSTYVRFQSTTMSETDFLKDVAARSGCGMLLDVNNVYVSATNHAYEPIAYLEAFPLDLVGEIHIGGHSEDRDDLGAPLLIDAHNCAAVDPVWRLYEWVIDRIGARPTLVEWDNDLPEWPELEAEARRADEILTRCAASDEASNADAA